MERITSACTAQAFYFLTTSKCVPIPRRFDGTTKTASGEDDVRLSSWSAAAASSLLTRAGWEQYHTPRNLAALIASEAGELLALFRWDQDSLADRPAEVSQELADVFLGVLRFADVAGIDLVCAAEDKLRLNAERYPAGPNADPDVIQHAR